MIRTCHFELKVKKNIFKITNIQSTINSSIYKRDFDFLIQILLKIIALCMSLSKCMDMIYESYFTMSQPSSRGMLVPPWWARGTLGVTPQALQEMGWRGLGVPSNQSFVALWSGWIGWRATHAWKACKKTHPWVQRTQESKLGVKSYSSSKLAVSRPRPTAWGCKRLGLGGILGVK